MCDIEHTLDSTTAREYVCSRYGKRKCHLVLATPQRTAVHTMEVVVEGRLCLHHDSVCLDAVWVVRMCDDRHQQAHDQDADQADVHDHHNLAPHCQEGVVTNSVLKELQAWTAARQPVVTLLRSATCWILNMLLLKPDVACHMRPTATTISSQ